MTSTDQSLNLLEADNSNNMTSTELSMTYYGSRGGILFEKVRGSGSRATKGPSLNTSCIHSIIL